MHSTLKSRLQEIKNRSSGQLGKVKTRTNAPMAALTIKREENREERVKALVQEARDLADMQTLIIESTSLTILGDEDIVREAVCEVGTAALKAPLGAQIPGSLFDIRMGPIDIKSICTTCQGTCVSEQHPCPGHTGMIDLGGKIDCYVYSPSFIDTLFHVLKCVCPSCSSLLVPKELIARDESISRAVGRARLSRISALAEGRPCQAIHTCECGEQLVPKARSLECESSDCPYSHSYQPCESRSYVFTKFMEVKGVAYRLGTEKTIRRLPILQVKAILDSISDEDAILMGFGENSHPRKLIVSKWLVTNPYTRIPKHVGNQRNAHPLDSKYIKVISEVEEYKKARESSGRIGSNRDTELEDKRWNVYLAILAIVEGDSGSQYRSNRPEFEGIKAYLSDKMGTGKGLSQGKRNNFTGRTVIGPDPCAPPGWVSIPYELSKKLTTGIKVQEYNRELCMRWLRSGIIVRVLFGMNHSRYAGQTMRINARNSQKIELSYGDTVERYLLTGDWVVVNRQPTLKRGGIMAYRALVVKGKIGVGLNLVTTTVANADFDGDEASVHKAQSLLSHAEMLLLLGVERQILDSEANSAVMGVVFDGVLAAYLLTSDKMFVDKTTFMSILMNVQNPDKHSLFSRAMRFEKMGYPFSRAVREARKITSKTGVEIDWSLAYQVAKREQDNPVPLKKKRILFWGRLLFSSALPANFMYKSSDVLIVNGIMLQGRLTKKIIGPSAGGIVHQMALQYGNDVTLRFLQDAYRLLGDWFDTHSYSIGMMDCITSDPQLPSKIERESKVAQLEIVENRESTLTALASQILDMEGYGNVNIQDLGWIIASLELTGTERNIAIARQLSLIKIKREQEATKTIDFTGVRLTAEQKKMLDRQEDFTIKRLVAQKSLCTTMAIECADKTVRSLTTIVPSGAKGAEFNLGSIEVMIGQQQLERKRIPTLLTGGKRTSTSFPPNSQSLESRGFCRESFSQGLGPTSLFFHAMASREGTIDTSQKTSAIGYLRNKIVKAIEGYVVRWDRSVRADTGVIIQFLYGEDGLDGANIVQETTYKGELTNPFNIRNIVNNVNGKYARSTLDMEAKVAMQKRNKEDPVYRIRPVISRYNLGIKPSVLDYIKKLEELKATGSLDQYNYTQGNLLQGVSKEHLSRLSVITERTLRSDAPEASKPSDILDIQF